VADRAQVRPGARLAAVLNQFIEAAELSILGTILVQELEIPIVE
jgi:hypothetical protein